MLFVEPEDFFEFHPFVPEGDIKTFLEVDALQLRQSFDRACKSHCFLLSVE
jgi:hypothetical protein